MKKSIRKTILSLVLALAMVAGLLPSVTSPVWAAGTTYDFVDLSASKTAGYYTFGGNRFKVGSDDDVDTFTPWEGVTSGAITAFFPTDSAAMASSGDPYTVIIKAEGGTNCKTFTFVDLGLSAYNQPIYAFTFSSFRITFNDASGKEISSESFSAPPVEVSQTSVLQLSNITGHGVWNVSGVASIKMEFLFLANGLNTGAGNLQFENITLANVSPYTAPAVTTDTISTYTATTATAGGNVTGSGGDTVTEKGVVYSTSASPTVGGSGCTKAAGSYTAPGAETGAFTSSLTGLTPGTEYHVRAYATNSVNTAYGDEVTFTTDAAPTYALTVSGGGTGATASGSYASGTAVPINAGTRTGYNFSGWTSSGGGAFGDASLASTTFAMPAGAATITAGWTAKTAVTITETAQTVTYSGTAKAFAVSGTPGTGFIITYNQGAGDVTPTNAGNYNVVISRVEDETYAAYSKTVTDGLVISKASQTAPTVGKTNETVSGNNDGTITGVDSTMEYKLTGAGSYTAVTPSATTITGLAPGTYLVRYQAASNYNAGTDASVTIAIGGAPTYALTVSGGGTGATASGSYASGASVPINAGTRTGFNFSGWTSSGGGTFGDASLASTTFAMPAGAATITAGWTAKTAVAITETAQTVTYSGTAKAFTVSGTPGTGFIITYNQGAGDVTPTNAGNYNVVISRVEDETYAAYSKTVTDGLMISKASQTAPTVGKTNETVSGNNDGTITGVTDLMEYKLTGAGSYTAVAPAATTITGLAPGTYLVRYHAASNYNAGTDASVTIAIGGAPTYALTVSGGGTGATASGSYASGASVTINAGTRTGYNFSGWTSSGGGTFGDASLASTTFTMPAGAATITAGWTVITGGGSGGGTGGGTNITPPNSANIIIDGKNESVGTAATSGNTTTVTVDTEKTETKIKTAAEGSAVTVPITGGTGTTAQSAVLVAETIKQMAEKDMTLQVQTGSINYQLPSTAIDLSAIDNALGAAGKLSDIKMNVTIAQSSSNIQNALSTVESEDGFKILLAPVEFTVTATYGGKSYEVSTFTNFVAREIEITADQAKKVTTAIVYEDGSVRHVPTEVVEKGGKWYAVIHSMTNSSYSLIYNEASFSDTEGKWYDDAVTEMASRKIINGIGKDMFAGGKAITRAEFAAIIVRSLGLPADGAASFADVSEKAWYHGAVGTAYEYGIAGGKGNNKFEPNAKISREEAMSMIYRASKIASFPALQNARNLSAEFSDYGKQSTWAEESVTFNLNNNLIKGANGKINAKAEITRAEVATVVLRFLQRAGLIDDRTAI